METGQYIRRPFSVDAVRVTADNLMSVALWCGGEVRSNVKGETYIKVWVNRPASERQTMAFNGDWVVYAGTGYKVYTHGAFRKTFVEKPEEACGRTDFTADHKPCVLGAGHRELLGVKIGCRSLTDYKLYNPAVGRDPVSLLSV